MQKLLPLMYLSLGAAACAPAAAADVAPTITVAAPTPSAASAPAARAEAPRTELPGTGVSLTLPRGFTKRPGSAAVTSPDRRLSIGVTSMTAAHAEQMWEGARFTSCKPDQQCKARERVTVEGREGALFYAYDDAHEEHRRNELLIHDASGRTVSLDAFFPTSAERELWPIAKHILISAHWDPSVPVDPAVVIGVVLPEDPNAHAQPEDSSFVRVVFDAPHALIDLNRESGETMCARYFATPSLGFESLSIDGHPGCDGVLGGAIYEAYAELWPGEHLVARAPVGPLSPRDIAVLRRWVRALHAR